MSKSDFKILAFDDEKDILLLLKYNLESEGYYVETAKSGKEGIAVAEKINPNLIIIMITKTEDISHTIESKSLRKTGGKTYFGKCESSIDDIVKISADALIYTI